MSKIVGPETSVPKMCPGHIVTAYEDKVQMYNFSPFLHPVFHWKGIQCMGKEGSAVCSTLSPSEQAQDHNSSEDRDGEGQRRDTLQNPAHCLLRVTLDM